MIYDGDITPIIKTVKHIQVDLNLSNNDIADRMEKSKQTISNLLKGRQPNVTLETLHSLCQALDCQLEINIVPLDHE